MDAFGKCNYPPMLDNKYNCSPNSSTKITFILVLTGTTFVKIGLQLLVKALLDPTLQQTLKVLWNVDVPSQTMTTDTLVRLDTVHVDELQPGSNSATRTYKSSMNRSLNMSPGRSVSDHLYTSSTDGYSSKRLSC